MRPFISCAGDGASCPPVSVRFPPKIGSGAMGIPGCGTMVTDEPEATGCSGSGGAMGIAAMSGCAATAYIGAFGTARYQASAWPGVSGSGCGGAGAGLRYFAASKAQRVEPEPEGRKALVSGAE